MEFMFKAELLIGLKLTRCSFIGHLMEAAFHVSLSAGSATVG